MMSNAKHWSITINNYSPEELETIKLDHGETIYVCGQEEVSESGTPHIQAFVSFKQKKRLSGVKKMYGSRLHAVPSKGSPAQNRKYCSKSETAVPNTFFEIGECPEPEPGKRSDLEAFKITVRDDGVQSIKRLYEEHSEVCAKYPRFVSEYIRHNLPEPAIESHPLRDWQQELNTTLNLPPDSRKVIFVVDEHGNAGKSWFARYYCSLHDKAFLMRPGKHADMAYLVPQP